MTSDDQRLLRHLFGDDRARGDNPTDRRLDEFRDPDRALRHAEGLRARGLEGADRVEALSWLARGDIPRAEELLQAAVRDPRALYSSWWLLADLRREQGRAAEAESGYREALARCSDPDRRTGLVIDLAATLAELGRAGDALAALEATPGVDPDDPDVAALRVPLLDAGDRTDEARALAERMLRELDGEARPAAASLAAWLGFRRLRDGDDPDAVWRFAAGWLARCPDDDDLRRLLAAAGG